MTIVLDQRSDQSLAVYIDGDLQFDSRDEGVYHELLALPALALAQARRPKRQLRALICGGGDGFVARELLKSTAIKQIDLVDYDPTILDLAQNEWPELNQHAMINPRLKVHICDAVQFVDQAAQAADEYDLIICDFTVPRDQIGARLHSIDWYQQLAYILHPQGVIAVNAASPSQTPVAYWMIYNSIRTANLNPKPYRFSLPSFTEAGYGDDWGFFVGSRKAFRPREFDHLALAEPREFLHDSEQLKRAFAFPAALAEKRAIAQPTKLASDALLHSLFAPTWDAASGTDWTSLDFVHDPAPLPKPHTSATLMPNAVQQALQADQGLDESQVFEQVVQVMPALRAEQTRSMVAEFIANPLRFLNSLDLRRLVEALLRRSRELPRKLVAELRLLRRHLQRTWENPQLLLSRGLRIVSVIALVIILANLLHPDTTYAKGDTSAGSGATSSQSMVRTNSPYDVVQAPPSTVEGRGFSSGTYGRGSVIDEYGSAYPTRRYRYYGSYYGGSSYRNYNRNQRPSEDPNEGDALYRLTPETDILANGEVVISLTDQAYLLLADQVMTVVDAEDGLPIVFLQRDEALVWRTHRELDRQRRGLDGSVKAKQDWIDWVSWAGFVPWRNDDQAELNNIVQTRGTLDQAIKSLGSIPANQPAIRVAPTAGGFQLFSSVWMNAEGTLAILEQPDGSKAYLNKTGWFSDSGLTQPLSEPYPEEFRTKVLIPFLTKQTTEYAAIKQRIEADLTSVKSDLSLLNSDKTEYTSIQSSYGPSDIVEYGTTEIRVDEALRRTNDDIARTEQLIQVLNDQLSALPKQDNAAKKFLQSLK
ncbi:spermine/spermidine synthase domain-containing protein [Herpetosiphon geysericola]|uniref:Polyamine aminopropyltransferase n=1 Tax=Herpetosiphon geysericola TaxID=70996 RepID=A0A0P6YAY6_9CHLR|nr:hypothetical protein [Herpetosiphon geysericola]KPL88876.1 hypothetical protein SE18_09410 [Herpetosiphon geysericola]